MEMQFEVFDLSDGEQRHSGAMPEHVRLAYLIDNTPAIIYSSVPTGDFKLTFVSNNVTRLLGYQPAEMLADPNFWFDHIHPDDAPTIFSSLALLFVEDQRTYEYRFRASDGAYFWMHDTLRLIRDEHGSPIEVIGSMTDITTRKLMEQEQKQLIVRLQEAHDQLLQSEKMASIGQLAAGIAHEINNPVGFVNSNMGSLRGYVARLFAVLDAYEAALPAGDPLVAAQLAAIRKKADLEFLKQDVNELVAESMDGLRRVKDIVQALKDFSHVGETDWQVADLHQGLESTLNIVNNEIKYKATVVRNFGQLPPVTCLASQLNQVFLNLLVNAAHAIAGHGEITVSTGGDGDWVWVAVADNGAGIAPEHLNRIFEPFFTTKPVGSGTGLGLSLSYGIVNKHGGRIDVVSEQGRGTTFTVHLPVLPAGATST